MRRLILNEHSKIYRWDRKTSPPIDDGRIYLEQRLYERLRRYDKTQNGEKDQVFLWEDAAARTRQWVGVVQLSGLQVEILPKVDLTSISDVDTNSERQFEVRRNLLYMLAIAGEVPVRSRDVARLTSRKAPLSETLAAIFAKRLLFELLRGPEKAYLEREENIRQFKGKLIISQQALKNAAHRERFFCRYDDFSDDTLMNRIFRAACRFLLGVTRSPSTQDVLGNCLLILEQVADIEVYDHLFERVHFTRQNERFEDLFQFCRLVLAGRAPTIQAGKGSAFSLLFDMNHVFERFIAVFLKQRVLPRIDSARLFPQARNRRKHLFVSQGKGVLPLKPDLLVESNEGQRFVIDTKWKQLDGRMKASPSDLYQLFAYTRRYGCNRSALLYPNIPGVSHRDFGIIDADDMYSGKTVGIRFVNLHRDLHSEKERQLLADELEDLISWGFGTCDEVQSLAVTGGQL